MATDGARRGHGVLEGARLPLPRGRSFVCDLLVHMLGGHMLGGYRLCGHRLRDHTGGAAVTGWVTCGSGPAAIEVVSLTRTTENACTITHPYQATHAAIIIKQLMPQPSSSSSSNSLHCPSLLLLNSSFLSHQAE